MPVVASTVPPGSELDRRAGPVGDWRHAVETSVGTSDAEALDWARATFDRAPWWLWLFLVVGWRLLLLERPSRSDETHLLGWTLAHVSSDEVVLSRASGLGLGAALRFVRVDGRASFGSALWFKTPVAKGVWAIVGPVHRWTARRLLAHAATLLQAPPH